MKGPKILCFDIETTPIEVYAWALGEQYVGLDQLKEDWSILSFSGRWLGDDKMIHHSTKDRKNKRDDSKLMKKLWKLLDEADLVLTQNGKKFDSKKVNARFVLNGMQPPSHYRHIDTLVIARKVFGFTSNKLAYMTDKLCKKYKKMTVRQFPGMELQKACLAGNKAAFKELEVYNNLDVLSTEELYGQMSAWDSTINFNLYHDKDVEVCRCGNSKLQKRGFYYTSAGKYQKYRCKGCGHETYAGRSLLSKKVNKQVSR